MLGAAATAAAAAAAAAAAVKILARMGTSTLSIIRVLINA